MTWHMGLPKMKSLRRNPVSVKGMHTSPSRRSDTARFSSITLVGVRMRLFWEGEAGGSISAWWRGCAKISSRG